MRELFNFCVTDWTYRNPAQNENTQTSKNNFSEHSIIFKLEQATK